MAIWVTKKKIKNGDGEGVEWMKFMNVSVPTWSSLIVYGYKPSYYMDEKIHSLVLCSLNEKLNTCIYIAKGDKFHEIEIKDLVGYETRHHAYILSLVPVPNDDVNQHVGSSYFALPKGTKANDGAGENEWDDGFFDSVKKISIGRSHLGVVFVRFEYTNDNVVVAGAAHGDDATYT
ncbi:PREDICTED: jacalin-related lectin 38-like [Camelina sativa]|uniref:Jacalin-related lectin 38-like n=1 Tax=Camelina sativa TaxID=90675 RepID=A0ABM1RM06_CAMSA|nr:PREDICTED: jacalin-related lectin 38-like [Camelina sativa]